MKRSTTIASILLVLVILGMMGCEATDNPDPIYDPNDPGAPTPTIVSIDPPDQAFEGISTVTITGTNFSSVPGQNQVTFNGRLASIDVDASNATRLVVTAPIVISDDEINEIDSVQIMVAVQGAYAGAVYDQNFTIKRAVVNWGGFAGEVPSKEPNAVAVDASENLYVAGGDGLLYKVTPEGERTEFGDGLSSITKDLCVAPGGYVLFARNNPFVYRIDPTGGDADRWLRVDGKITCMDFDANGVLYCAGSSDSVFAVDVTAETFLGMADYVDYDLVALRVYDGYLYVSGIYDGTDSVDVIEGLWKHEILDASGTLGPRTLVLDWSDFIGDAGQHIRSILVDADGLFYLGLSEGYDALGNFTGGDALLTFDPATGSLTPFYDSVLLAPGGHMKWGTGNYIYAARFIPDIETVPGAPELALLRIEQTKTSAPYYGRQ